MAARSNIINSPPYAVEQVIKTLGNNIRTARLRRGLTLQEVAEKIGSDRKAISEAERGKIATSIALDAAACFGRSILKSSLPKLHLQPMTRKASPLLRVRERLRARRSESLNNDF